MMSHRRNEERWEDQRVAANPFWRRYINPRCFGEGRASAPMKVVSKRNKAASFLAAVLFIGANAEPFQYNVVITAPAEPKPPFHGLD